MFLLTLGVALFTLIHLYPCFAVAHRARLRERLGENRYKGLFLPAGVCRHRLHHRRLAVGQRLTALLPAGLGADDHDGDDALCADPLLFSGQGSNHLRRWLVHPQLLGTLLWAVAHLLVNSEARSLVLFGGIGLWALVSIVWISVREWQQAPRPAANWTGTGISVGAGLVATALLVFWGHGWLTGIPLH